MDSIFVAADAFVALNDRKDPNHQRSVEFVHSLFSRTVRVFTNQHEISIAAYEIRRQVDDEQMMRFLDLVFDGTITVVNVDDGIIERANDLLSSIEEEMDLPAWHEVVRVIQMRQLEVKDLFSFNQGLKPFNILVWPK